MKSASTILLLATTILFVSIADSRADSDFEKTLLPFFEKNCIQCHGPEKEKGDMRLDLLPPVIEDEYGAELWQEVLDTLNGAEMPPEDEPQPSTDELAGAIAAMTDTLFEARKRLVDSESVTIRRLNKREYGNTIRDLLGVHVDTSSLPADGTLDGIDTVGDAQFMSVPQFERYLELGRKALDRALVNGPRPESFLVHNDPETSTLRKLIKSTLHDKQADVDKHTAALAAPDLSEDEREHLEGRLKKASSALMNTKGYLAQPAAQSGFILDISREPFGGQGHDKVSVSLPRQKEKSSSADRRPAKLGDPIGRYVARFRAGLTAPPTNGERLHVEMILTDAFSMQVSYERSLGTFEITRSIEDPHVFEVPFENLGELKAMVALRIGELNDRFAQREGRGEKFEYPDSTQRPYIWVDWLEVEGPFFEEWPPAAWQTTFFKGDTVGTEEETTYAREIITRFAKRAYRGREITPAFLGKLEDIYADYRGSGESFTDSVKEALAVVLASPSFVYLVEQPGETEQKRRLDDLELASRLSYFLWSHPPDQELLDLVGSGTLTQPEVLSQQVDRLLDDPKSRNFTKAFISQWLELEWLDMIVVNTGHYPRFSELVRKSMREEPVEMFQYLIEENRGIADFIDSDYVMADSTLSRFYDLHLPEDTGGFQRVSLPEDSPRGGLLGMGAILTMTSTGERTSPVERGVFVYSHLLGRSIPPPPPNVPQLEISDDDLTIRETLSAHVEQAQCASCHRRMDPLGFGLEHFDAVGLWREQESQFIPREENGRIKRVQLAIDATGTMPDRKRNFNGHEELKAHLTEDCDAMATGFLRSLLTYSLGRRVGFSDSNFVDAIQADWKKQNYGMRSLIHAVVQSEEFKTK